MKLHFTPGPYERKSCNGRISLPDEDVRALMAVQKTRELACIAEDNFVLFYPLFIYKRIFELAGRVGMGECSLDIAKRIDEKWKSLFLMNINAQIVDIDNMNRLYIPKNNSLRQYSEVTVSGYANYFTIGGKND